MIKCISTTHIYSNPKPHLRSRQAYHPSLVPLENGEILCTFDLCEAVQSMDYRTYLSRSIDNGQTWTLQSPLFEPRDPARGTGTMRINRLSGGQLIGFGCRWLRTNPEEGRTNPATMGMCPMELITIRSEDAGRTWSDPVAIDPPLVGPCFEICHPIIEVDGRWLAPTSTWRGWNGELGAGDMAVALISEDAGRTWPRYGITFDGRAEGIIHWEQSVAPLKDGRLLAVSWAYQPKTGSTLPTPYVISRDGGMTFSAPRATGLRAQTCKILPLPDDRILCVYRRSDQPGLWASLARLKGDEWLNEEPTPLWGGALRSSGMDGQAASLDELRRLQFGYPSLRQLPNGEILCAFWCQEDCQKNIRLLRLAVS